MPCTGSLKSGDSIMLSCLSPRRPCCGPKAALILISLHEANASSVCVRSFVTEAGCASKATRLPPSGARREGSLRSRSTPNCMTTRPEELHRQNHPDDESPASPAGVPKPSKRHCRSYLQLQPINQGANELPPTIRVKKAAEEKRATQSDYGSSLLQLQAH